ncbi:MAG TPA: galactose-1-phosphate uridylyltransferase [Candidatus Paceibacterota bacterium]
MKNTVEFRKDIVSGEWVLISSDLTKKPLFFKKSPAKPLPKSKCPFENPVTSGNEKVLLWYPKPGKNDTKDWWTMIFSNKYPVVFYSKICPIIDKNGIYEKIQGVGFQEVVVTRDHDRHFGKMNTNEIEVLIEAYVARFQALLSEECVEYILIMHNHGPASGASVPHPHSQILAIPLVPPDVASSILGSKKYFQEHKRCAHCDIIKFDIKEKKRIVYENKHFIVIAPYASKMSFETRIYPKIHESRFEAIDINQRQNLADAMKFIFSKFETNLNNPDYNMVVHTAPPKNRDAGHYHWHVEILPRVGIWGGLELGTGIDVVKIPPEEAAKILRK